MSEKQLNPVVAYARYSSANQREASIEEQMDIVNGYAKKHGMKVIKWFKDSAISGTSMKGRDGIEELLSYLSEHKGEISYILCHKLDRLSRDSGDISNIRKKAKYCGTEIICVSDNLNTEDPFSTMNIALASGMAQHYSENLSREVRRGLEYNAKKCVSTGGIPPLGYDIDSSNKKLIINDAEAEIVQLIFERYGEDNFSYKEIVNELLKKGYKTKVGNDFKKTSLHEILRNEKYRGVYTYNKKSSKDIYGKRNNHKNKSDDEIIRIPDGCPRIISDELWDKVQSRLANNEIRAYSTEERYLLRNKIFCGECGERMYGNRRKSGKNKKLYVTYNCAGRQKGNGCMNKGINREIEKFVMVQIRSAFLPKNKAKTIATNLNEWINVNKVDRKNRKINKQRISVHVH